MAHRGLLRATISPQQQAQGGGGGADWQQGLLLQEQQRQQQLSARAWASSKWVHNQRPFPLINPNPLCWHNGLLGGRNLAAGSEPILARLQADSGHANAAFTVSVFEAPLLWRRRSGCNSCSSSRGSGAAVRPTAPAVLCHQGTCRSCLSNSSRNVKPQGRRWANGAAVQPQLTPSAVTAPGQALGRPQGAATAGAAGPPPRRSAIPGSGASRSLGPVPGYPHPLPAVGPPLLTSLSDPSPLTGGGGQEGEAASGEAGTAGQDQPGRPRQQAMRQMSDRQSEQQQHLQQPEQEFFDYFAEP